MIMPCSASVGRNFIKYIYTGEIEEDVLKEEAATFLDLGEMYEINGLKELAEENMLATLNEDNMIEYFLAGDKYKAGKIRKRAKNMLKLNLKKVMGIDNW